MSPMGYRPATGMTWSRTYLSLCSVLARSAKRLPISGESPGKEVKRYWCKKGYREGKFRPFYEDEDFASQGEDNDARLDALAVLATLPKRLVEIGYDRLNEKELNTADQQYWVRHKAKLDCRNNGRKVSDWERRRIAHLHNEGLSVYQITKATGRHRATVKLCLNEQKVN